MAQGESPERDLVVEAGSADDDPADHCTMSVRVKREAADRFARLARSNGLSRSMLVRLMMADALRNGLPNAVKAAADALQLAKASA